MKRALMFVLTLGTTHCVNESNTDKFDAKSGDTIIVLLEGPSEFKNREMCDWMGGRFDIVANLPFCIGVDF